MQQDLRPTSAATQTPRVARADRLDALRGAAMLWMAAFHFAFDLNHFGLIPRQDFYRDPVWTTQRVLIVSLFLFCAGFGQALALQGEGGGVRLDRRFWRRWAQVAVCALLVTAGSLVMFPASFIHFGVLHGIALMLIVLRLSAPLGAGLWLLGALAIALPQFVSHPFFDSRWTDWLGLYTRRPRTEDHVPLLPWLGVMWWGLAAGRWALGQRPGALGAALPRALRPLAALGRWPLAFYMLHQPLLIGGLTVWRMAAR